MSARDDRPGPDEAKDNAESIAAGAASTPTTPAWDSLIATVNHQANELTNIRAALDALATHQQAGDEMLGDVLAELQPQPVTTRPGGAKGAGQPGHHNASAVPRQASAATGATDREIRGQATVESEDESRINTLESELRTARAEVADHAARIDWAQGELIGFEEAARRVAESHAWRLGHRLMRAVRFVTFRRAKGVGAMPRLLRHAERAQEALGLPGPRPPAPRPRPRTAPAGRSEPDSPAAALRPPVDVRGILRGERSREPGSVDVVVCVHNALGDVHRCFSSIIERSTRPLRLIVVDDGSGKETARYLDAFAARNPTVDLQRKASPPHGYTIAANIGLRASTADYVVLLNSDTVVTRGWLEHLTTAGDASASSGVIGPLSNAASAQSVPEYQTGGNWAINQLPRWLTEDALALVVANLSGRTTIPVPFLNGFCFCIRRRAIEAVGLFDEEQFAAGYSEENDYSRRVAEAGLHLIVAPRAYVYHSKSRSYGHEARRELATRHYRKFLKRYGEEEMRTLVESMQRDPALAALRSRIREAITAPRNAVALLPKLQVTFVLPALPPGGSGGSHSIYQEVSAMRSLGLQARIGLASSAWQHAENAYRDARDVFILYDDFAELAELTRGDDVVVATHHRSVSDVASLIRRRPACLGAYYVQDYEPLFAPAGSSTAAEARRSYREIPEGLLFAKTEWLQQTLADELGVAVAKVEPSLDRDVFNPLVRHPGEGRVHLVAMLRPRTPRRRPSETLAVLADIADRFGDRVRITTFGCDDEAFWRLEPPRSVMHRGVLTREQVASLFQEADVFLDCSVYQAFGRTGLEAMACGATAVLPARGGVTEFARHGVNAVLVDTSDLEATVSAVATLVEDRSLLEGMKANAAETAAAFSPVRAALSEYSLFCHEHARRRAMLV